MSVFFLVFLVLDEKAVAKLQKEPFTFIGGDQRWKFDHKPEVGVQMHCIKRIGWQESLLTVFEKNHEAKHIFGLLYSSISAFGLRMSLCHTNNHRLQQEKKGI